MTVSRTLHTTLAFIWTDRKTTKQKFTQGKKPTQFLYWSPAINPKRLIIKKESRQESNIQQICQLLILSESTVTVNGETNSAEHAAEKNSGLQKEFRHNERI
jgi:hypothetical protein